MPNSTRNPSGQGPEIVDIEELIAELTLLTDTETIPQSTLLGIVARSHIASLAIIKQIQKAQDAMRDQQRIMQEQISSTLELLKLTNNRIEEATDPDIVFEKVAVAKRNLLIAWSIGIPLLISLMLLPISIIEVRTWIMTRIAPTLAGMVLIICIISILVSIIILQSVKNASQAAQIKSRKIQQNE